MPPDPDTVFITDHGAARIAERDILEVDSVNAVKHPDYKRKLFPGKGSHGGFTYEIRKNIGKRTLIVITEIQKNLAWIITCYWESDDHEGTN